MTQLTKNGEILCRESFYGTFFKSSYHALLEAQIEFERKFVMAEGEPSLENYYRLLDLKPPEDSKTIGWSHDYMEIDWETDWIDFLYKPAITEDGRPYIDISYPIPPVSLLYDQHYY